MEIVRVAKRATARSALAATPQRLYLAADLKKTFPVFWRAALECVEPDQDEIAEHLLEAMEMFQLENDMERPPLPSTWFRDSFEASCAPYRSHFTMFTIYFFF